MTPVQFPDIPVPAGMTLITNRNQSHSHQVGDYRRGDFYYSGNNSLNSVVDYMVQRMPLNGWELTSRNPPTEAGANAQDTIEWTVSSSEDPIHPTDEARGYVELRFVRRPQTANCAIWRETSGTTMKVEVRTDFGR